MPQVMETDVVKTVPRAILTKASLRLSELAQATVSRAYLSGINPDTIIGGRSHPQGGEALTGMLLPGHQEGRLASDGKASTRKNR